MTAHQVEILLSLSRANQKKAGEEIKDMILGSLTRFCEKIGKLRNKIVATILDDHKHVVAIVRFGTPEFAKKLLAMQVGAIRLDINGVLICARQLSAVCYLFNNYFFR